MPLDHSGAVPGHLALRVARLDPRRPGEQDVAPVFFLAGGPGQAATPLLTSVPAMVGAPALANRRFITFDQRGTGGSGRLHCPAPAGVKRADETVGQCARALGARASLFTSLASVYDLEAVRAALGVDRMVLFGVSYGTKVALDYASRYPQHVSKLILDSVVPQSGSDLFLRPTIAAIPGMLAGLCANRGCPFAPSAAADFSTLVKRAQRMPLHGTFYDGYGRAHRAAVTAGDLLDLLVAGDLDRGSRAQTPAAIHAAVHGDSAPLLRLLHQANLNGSSDLDDSAVLFLATSCTDGPVPWAPGTPVDQRAAAARAALAAAPRAELAPFDPEVVANVADLGRCAQWPDAPVVQPTPPLPDVPALLVSGTQDLRTPRSNALAVAAQLPHAHVLTVSGIGHSVLSQVTQRSTTRCVGVAIDRFIAGGTPPAACAQRGVRVARPSPHRLADVPARAGLPKRLGRTYNAVKLTIFSFNTVLEPLLDEVVYATAGGKPTTSVGTGGLYGGALRIDLRGEGALNLRSYSEVRGVTVSGSISLADRTDSATLRVGGGAAARGVLHFRGDTVDGTLGGRPVHFVDRLDSEESDTAAEAVASAASAAVRLPGLRASLRPALWLGANGR